MNQIVMNKEKDCKHSVKYSTNDPNAVVTNVYVSNRLANPMPDKVTVTIEAGGAAKGGSKKSKKGKEEQAAAEGE